MCGSVSRTSAIRSAETEAQRQDDEHHREHQEREDNLHGVLHKSNHVPNLNLGLGDFVSTHPDDQDAEAIHQQHHDWHHDHHRPG